MISYTRGKWKLESCQTGCCRIICDTDFGNEIPVAVIHHQTFQVGKLPLTAGSGTTKERTANAQLLLNAADMYEYGKRLRGLLRALALELDAAKNRYDADQVKLSLDKIITDFPFFQIIEWLGLIDELTIIPDVPIIKSLERAKHKETPTNE